MASNIYRLARQVLDFVKIIDPYEAKDLSVKEIKDLLITDRISIIDSLNDCIENDNYAEEAAELLEEFY